jgi:hypothetical protein
MLVRISAKSARIRFQGCAPDYILNTCHGKCCETAANPAGTRIPVTKQDAAALAKFDVQIVDGLLVSRPGETKCPFKQATGFCGIHISGEKPFGCWVSPFKLTGKKPVLVIRKRYIGMKCHADFRETGLPAYRAFHSSLVRLFGEKETERITKELDGGSGDFYADMLLESYKLHMENERTLKPDTPMRFE